MRVSAAEPGLEGLGIGFVDGANQRIGSMGAPIGDEQVGALLSSRGGSHSFIHYSVHSFVGRRVI